ncbi:MAG TPA: redoxin family protein, partial [Rhodothermales bacterium]|nr:redoxin family protein [Rhodothermales bacterium]
MKRLLLLALLALTTASVRAQELPLGSPLPQITSLTATDGSGRTLDGMAGPQGTVVVLWSNNCPWVDRLDDRLMDLAATYADRYAFVLVGSADPTANAQRASVKGYRFPYLSDSGNALARALGAQRTATFFVFDASGALAYVGAFDNSPTDVSRATAHYLRDA